MSKGTCFRRHTSLIFFVKKETYLRNVYLAFVHKINYGCNVCKGRVLQNHYLVGFTKVDEKVFKIRAASGEDHLKKRRGVKKLDSIFFCLTLWHFICFPSAAIMTSVNCSCPNNLVKTLSMLFWWLFHLRQYCCDPMVPPGPPILSTIQMHQICLSEIMFTCFVSSQIVVMQ